jgi:hypothetical protein
LRLQESSAAFAASAQTFGALASVVGGGIGTILVVLLVMWRWPRLLHLRALR